MFRTRLYSFMVSTDKMVSTIGYFSEDGMPMKHLDKTTCGICGELNVGTDENGQPEKQVWTSSEQSLVWFTPLRTKAWFSVDPNNLGPLD